MLLFTAILALRPSVTLVAVGDVMLDRYVGRAIASEGTDYPFAKIRKSLAGDIVFGNLECPVTGKPKQLNKQFTFRVPPARTAALKGFSVMSVANNHTLDCGRPGLYETCQTLKAAGIASVGSNANTTPTILERQGLRIAFLAYSDFPEAVPDLWPAVSYWNEVALKQQITAAKRTADIVVVSAHWGVEGSAKVSARQRQQATFLSRAGADLILGHHPHVLQPVERIGRAVVAYSMGNFVFDATRQEERTTAIFRFELTKGGVKSWNLIPCQIQKARPVIQDGASTRSKLNAVTSLREREVRHR